jgi:hypothetical protein
MSCSDSISLLYTDQGVLYWYKKSGLLMHDHKIFAIDENNYLSELMLDKVEKNPRLVITLEYPFLPFYGKRDLLSIHVNCDEVENHYNENPADLIYYDDEEFFRLVGRTFAFFSMRHLPGHPAYVPPGLLPSQSRDLLTPKMLTIQGWMRKVSCKRSKSRNLALAMGLHDRLGADSCLFALSHDLFRQLINRN